MKMGFSFLLSVVNVLPVELKSVSNHKGGSVNMICPQAGADPEKLCNALACG